MPSSTAADPSVLTVLETLKKRSPDVPFLALGQTVFWDEPDKAVWRRLLDLNMPGAKLIAGVHDTDYFAKTSAHVGTDQKFIALPHDDGKTRDLWSAAGEMSSLFGSESVPTRAMYLANNVPFDWLGKNYPGGKNALYADKTQAWGWRGIVHTESHSLIANDIPIRDIKDALLEQLDWSFSESLACLADDDSRTQAAKVASAVRGWVLEYLETCSDTCRLSDLYETLLPRFYQLLLGAYPTNFQTTSSLSLFSFNRETFDNPRFNLINHFLDPKTRPIARAAYDRAVGGSGSGIYTLDAFGVGAIPFDLVIPGVGRGTIRLAPAALIVETTPAETFVPLSTRITTLEQLAAVVEDRFGPEVALVGKAVTLADMIAAEFLVVFHETASGYTSLTQAMNAYMAKHGVALALNPIVRLSYPTWDALAAALPETRLRLPSHLAATFGAETISAQDFSRDWREIVAASRLLLKQSRELPSLRALLGYLEGRDALCWCDRLTEYEAALKVLSMNARHSETLRGRVEEHQEEMLVWRKERAELERRKGEDWRHTLMPLIALRDAAHTSGEVLAYQKQIEREISMRTAMFDVPIETCRERITATRFLIGEFQRHRRELERSPEAVQARAQITEFTREAQMARLELVRSAFLTIESLEHTQLRPTSWWLPLVDSTGAWFEAMAAGTKARLEEL